MSRHVDEGPGEASVTSASIGGLDHLVLTVADVDATIAFYELISALLVEPGL
jgi:hypothetical protein